MLTRTTIKDKIVETLHAIEPSLADANIANATSLTDLKMDSLRLIELGVLLEDNFGKHVRFDEWLEQERGKNETPYSLDSLVTFVAKALSV